MWDGRLRLEPDWRHEIARWTGVVPDAAAPSGVAIEPVEGTERASLANAAAAAFAGSPDFFAVSDERCRQRLAEGIAEALDLEPEWVRRAQRLARAEEGVVGLLLLREVEGGVTLETVGVRPGWRRRGLGAAMLQAVLGALPDGVDVRSCWLIANRESGAWHRSVGFDVLPTSVSLHAHRIAERWTSGPPTLGDLTRLRDEVRAREGHERDGRAPDPFAFARPIHRRPTGVG